MSGSKLKARSYHKENTSLQATSTADSENSYEEDYEEVAPYKTNEGYYEDLSPRTQNKEKRKHDRKVLSLPTGLSSKHMFAKETEKHDRTEKSHGKDGFGGKVAKQMTKLKHSVEKKFGSSEKEKHEKSSPHSKGLSDLFRRKSEGHHAQNEYINDMFQTKATKNPQIKVHTAESSKQPGYSIKEVEKLHDDVQEEKETKESAPVIKDRQRSKFRDFTKSKDSGSSSDDDYLKPVSKSTPPAQPTRDQDKSVDCKIKEGNSSIRGQPKERTLPHDNDEVYDIVCIEGQKVMIASPERNITEEDPNKPTSIKIADEMNVPANKKAPAESTVKPDFDVTALTLEDVKRILRELGLEKYLEAFEKEHIDGLILSKLSAEDFAKELGMSRLEVIRLNEFVKSGHVPK